jgi:hypothetical protein
MAGIEEQIEKELDRLMDEIADEIFSISQEELDRLGTHDTGKLGQSGNIERKPLEKTIHYSVNYADGVEFGTEPHRVPFKAIYEWVQRKLGLRGSLAKSVAGGIVRKIAREGTNPQPFLRNSIEKFLSKHR